MAVKAKVTIHKDICKGCGLCVEFCPREVLALDEEINLLGYRPATLTDADKCNGCGFCYVVCPDLAVEVEKGGD